MEAMQPRLGRTCKSQACQAPRHFAMGPQAVDSKMEYHGIKPELSTGTYYLLQCRLPALTYIDRYLCMEGMSACAGQQPLRKAAYLSWMWFERTRRSMNISILHFSNHQHTITRPPGLQRCSDVVGDCFQPREIYFGILWLFKPHHMHRSTLPLSCRRGRLSPCQHPAAGACKTGASNAKSSFPQHAQHSSWAPSVLGAALETTTQA